MSYELWSEMTLSAQNSESMAHDKNLTGEVVKRLGHLTTDFNEFMEGPLKDTEYAIRAKSEFRKNNIEIPFNCSMATQLPRDAKIIHDIIRNTREMAKKDGFSFDNKSSSTTNNYNQTITADNVHNPTNVVNIEISAKDILIGMKGQIENDPNLPQHEKELAIKGLDTALNFGGNVLASLSASGLLEALKLL